jgi:cellulose synthase/poly-beta-1,6-N-acetylglucosamine synthase-like glycosyltransferase
MALDAIRDALFWSLVACLGYLVAVNALYFGLVLVAGVEQASSMRRRRADDDETLAGSRFTIPVSVVAAVYNEEPIVAASVRSLLALDYPTFEVILVNDGSTDGTLERLREDFQLEPRQVFYRRTLETTEIRAIYRSVSHPRLIVIDKPNSGKADSLNAGLNLSRYRFVCCVDGDTIFDRTALIDAMAPVVKDPGRILGVTSHVAISRQPELRLETPDGAEHLERHLLSNFQLLDYLRSFFNGRLAWSRLDFMLCAIGAFAVWRRDVLMGSGGFSTDYTCEDIEISFRIHERYLREKQDYAILSLASTVGATEGPDRIGRLVSQRARWQRVIMETVWSHRRMFLNPRYKAVGMLGVPFYVVSEVAAPFFEALALLMLPVALAVGAFDPVTFLLFTATIALVNGILTSTAVLLQDRTARSYPLRDLARLIALGPLDLFVYRPFLTYARLKGAWGFLRGDKTWDKFERNARAAPAR